MEDTNSLNKYGRSAERKETTLTDQLIALFGDAQNDGEPRTDKRSTNESFNNAGGGSEWPSNAETQKIRECFAEHLQPCVPSAEHPEERDGSFVEFTLFSNLFQQRKMFARINQTVVAQRGNIIAYELQVPRLNEKPQETRIPAKDLQSAQFYHFAFPLLISKDEENDFAGYLKGEKIMEDGLVFILREEKPKYVLRSNPPDRNKLPWVTVISSLFLRDLGLQRDSAKVFLTRLGLVEKRIIVNYKPGSGYAIKDFLGTYPEDEENIREVHNVARLIRYLRLDFSMLFNKPVNRLFSKESPK